MENVVLPGFSVTNRWLLYTSIMLTPAQLFSGLGSSSPSNIGFLAFNWYNQWVWYSAIKAHEIHALSLCPFLLNLVYAITYLGGISSGNIIIIIILGLGTAGLMMFNVACAWISWKDVLPDGYGAYQFFFFGWRTLTPGWRTFILCGNIADTLFDIGALVGIFMVAGFSLDATEDEDTPQSWMRYPLIAIGPPLALLITWPVILWIELIVHRNHIVSETDMISVYLFIGQVVLMILPFDIVFDVVRKHFKSRRSPSEQPSSPNKVTV
ncbi:hypothetical protein BKA70DRAFT_1301627 [Coprinopsis sp. MPI-PUGE-AT-0042]|nr:hypothetical protein BKA70DRAFT_1301627 [Coprinopsis sp. MPI-PUGE-AT-0042]